MEFFFYSKMELNKYSKNITSYFIIILYITKNLMTSVND